MNATRVKRECRWCLGAALFTAAFLVAAPGCLARKSACYFDDPDMAHFVAASTRIDYPATDPENCDTYAELAALPAPRLLDSNEAVEFYDLTLPEATYLALQNSKVLRELGGLILRSPDSVNTIHSPALQETDPRFGVERALSAFDASWSTQMFFEKNDRALNNFFFGGGTRLLQQDLFSYNSELSKRSAVGTRMTARHRVDYDFNNSPGNNIPNLPWQTYFDVEVRQPLLQGAGVDFNRIAGPGATPGVYNGVLIARINTDITLADFEAGVLDLVSDVETAYWELYFAYRNLDGTTAARDRALDTWRKVQAYFATGKRVGDPVTEARAREQYFRLDAEVQNALSGRLLERSRPTTFRGVGGIHTNERQLRLLLGLPINDGRMIRPTTEPSLAKVRFEWDAVLAESLMRRVELRKQQWKIKRRELEVLAAKNHLYPQFDIFSRYRWRGLGHDLLDSDGSGQPRFNDAFQNLLDGDFQEWQVGAEIAMPIGFRHAHTAVRNAQLNLNRDLAILSEQQREVSLEISNAIAEMDRAYHLAETNLNRRVAATDQLKATEAYYEAVDENLRARLLDVLLDAQRRLAEADSDYHRSLIEYTMAIKQTHYAKGSLLDYNDVALTEGPWPDRAYEVASQRDALRINSPRAFQTSPVVSDGPYPQDFTPTDGYEEILPPRAPDALDSTQSSTLPEVHMEEERPLPAA